MFLSCITFANIQYFSHIANLFCKEILIVTYYLLLFVYYFSPKSNKKPPHIPYRYAERPN